MTDITQLYGKHWFTWYDFASGGVQGVIETCKATGASGVLVKAADGANKWAQLAQDGPAIKAAGLILGAWDYVYPSVSAEIQAQDAASALKIADYLVLDAETEYEIVNGAEASTALGAAIRALEPTALIGYTSFGAPQDHAQFPYDAFAAWTDFCIPQIYWADFGETPACALNNALIGLSHLHKRIFPAGQAYSPATPLEIAEFSAACAERWIEGVFWWDIQSDTPALKQAVADSAVYIPKPPAPVKYQVVTGWFSESEALTAAAEIKKSYGWNSWTEKV